MECPLCGHHKAHQHVKMPNDHQRYRRPACQQTFCESFDSLYYRRHVSPKQIRQVLQAHSESSSLRGISRTSGLAYNTVVSSVRSASQKAQRIHNQAVQAVETEEVCACDNKREDGIRRQNKDGKVWKQPQVTTRLVVSYFNWIWQHSRFKTTAAQ